MPERDLPNESNGHSNVPELPEADPQDAVAANLSDVPAGSIDGGREVVPTGKVERVELAEETLEPRIVRKQVGEVLIHKSIETQMLRNDVEVEREQVAIEQLVVEEYVDEKREPWYEDDMLVIPVYEEVLVTERKLMLSKLVRVRREVRVEQAVVEGEVRREVLDVEPRSTGN